MFSISICRVVTVKDVSNGELTVIYDAWEALSGLKTPILKDPEVILSLDVSNGKLTVTGALDNGRNGLTQGPIWSVL